MDAFTHSTARARAGRVGQRRHWLPLLFECIDSVESADDLGADARELVLGLERVRLRLPTADVSALSEQTVYAAVAAQCSAQTNRCWSAQNIATAAEGFGGATLIECVRYTARASLRNSQPTVDSTYPVQDHSL